jgi:DNA-directed RNA polymerase sigma subunit (sigma70/sigma32)
MSSASSTRFSAPSENLVTALGREPTAGEIAELIMGMEPDEVQATKVSARAPISRERPVGDEEGSRFGDFIADERADSPYEAAVQILANEELRNALQAARATPREGHLRPNPSVTLGCLETSRE